MAYNADNMQCLNLTSKTKNGQLQWKAAAGHWNIIPLYIGKTFQKVKRAAPGGEGYVMNHLDKGCLLYTSTPPGSKCVLLIPQVS